MNNYPGITCAKRKNGDIYYRSSITVSSKHISLGSFSSKQEASNAYKEADALLRKQQYHIDDYNETFSLPFSKFISLMNLRDNHIYFKTPIYLHKSYFYYYLTPEQYFIFDREDVFFYASHKIQFRGGYCFVCDYGSQYSILSRFGIHSYARKGIDYVFTNGNEFDFRYENIRIINHFIGVTKLETSVPPLYECSIHIQGKYIVGRYRDAITAAIAYNKAADCLNGNGVPKKYIRNYIQSYTPTQYKDTYEHITISNKILHYNTNPSEKMIED